MPYVLNKAVFNPAVWNPAVWNIEGEENTDPIVPIPIGSSNPRRQAIGWNNYGGVNASASGMYVGHLKYWAGRYAEIWSIGSVHSDFTGDINQLYVANGGKIFSLYACPHKVETLIDATWNTANPTLEDLKRFWVAKGLEGGDGDYDLDDASHNSPFIHTADAISSSNRFTALNGATSAITVRFANTHILDFMFGEPNGNGINSLGEKCWLQRRLDANPGVTHVGLDTIFFWQNAYTGTLNEEELLYSGDNWPNTFFTFIKAMYDRICVPFGLKIFLNCGYLDTTMMADYWPDFVANVPEIGTYNENTVYENMDYFPYAGAGAGGWYDKSFKGALQRSKIVIAGGGITVDRQGFLDNAFGLATAGTHNVTVTAAQIKIDSTAYLFADYPTIAALKTKIAADFPDITVSNTVGTVKCIPYETEAPSYCLAPMAQTDLSATPLSIKYNKLPRRCYLNAIAWNMLSGAGDGQSFGAPSVDTLNDSDLWDWYDLFGPTVDEDVTELYKSVDELQGIVYRQFQNGLVVFNWTDAPVTYTLHDINPAIPADTSFYILSKQDAAMNALNMIVPDNSTKSKNNIVTIPPYCAELLAYTWRV